MSLNKPLHYNFKLKIKRKIMKNYLHNSLLTILIFFIPMISFAQAPDLGVAKDFVLFSTDGAVSNSGTSQLTGNVGTNNGSSTGFGNVNGVMHDGDTASAQAATDLLTAYNQLDTTTPGFFPAPSLGSGQTLTPGVYEVSGASTLNGNLVLDAQGNGNAVFILQIEGSLSTGAHSKVKLINGAKACNVFWKVEGAVNMATGTTMRGTVIANNAEIIINTGDTLEGRALSTTGKVAVYGVLANTPVGCGSPTLTGPDAPTLGEVGCYGLFSSDGPVENAGITDVKGDVGANVGLTTGFDTSLVTGNVHPVPDSSTEKAAADLSDAYNYLNGLAHDIELLYPAQFGSNLVLTPHTYLLDGATTFTDTLYLNASGEASAVFVIKINGALSTSTHSKVILTNETKAKNVYWLVNGAVDINDHSVFKGNIISQGAVNLNTGVKIQGRTLTGVGAMEVNAINSAAKIPSNCETVVGGGNSTATNEVKESQKSVTIYPNPFNNSITIQTNNASVTDQSELSIYNSVGIEVLRKTITRHSTTINTSNLPSGIYFYKMIGSDEIFQSGKIISQQ